jgi:hypothetical protein
MMKSRASGKKRALEGEPTKQPPKRRAKRSKKAAASSTPSPPQTMAGSTALSLETQELLESLTTKQGTLSDRLNPDHPCFDEVLKSKWKTLPRRERSKVVERDQELLRSQRVQEVHHPFPTDSNDHCETSAEAYRDIAPLLDSVAQRLGKTRQDLRIWDPYYCHGTMKKHLHALGFESVYNECEDFYEKVQTGLFPEHDVILTNPPYSSDHPERLLAFCKSHKKPAFLLMPNYVAAKPCFAKMSRDWLFVCPKKRYFYWTPKGLREQSATQSHASQFGNRTSPFISFWYVSVSPVMSKLEGIGAASRAGNSGSLHVCGSLSAIPASCQPSTRGAS